MIVVGLGNIGQKYSGTRHNVGFECIDIISRIYNVKMKEAYDGEFGIVEASSCNEGKLFLFKPGKYMNNSGAPVQKIAHYWKVSTENIIVVHDDLDIKCGVIRIKKGGGSGGHNGIKSIDSHLGNNYWRIRVGIGREKLISASEFVLRSFTKEEKVLIDRVLAIIGADIENIKSIVASEIARAELINRVNNAEYGII